MSGTVTFMRGETLHADKLNLALSTRVFATAIVSPTPPTGALPGSLWWSNVDGQLYVLYDDGTSIQWVGTQPVS